MNVSRDPDGGFLYIFLHLPKCAGTHFIRTITYNWSMQECLMVSPTVSRTFRQREDVDAYIRSVSASRREDVRFLCGHAVYYGIHEHFDRPARYVTFLRDPLSRLVSNFLHVHRHFDYFTAEGVQKLPHTVDELTSGWWLQHSQLNLQTAMTLNFLIDGGAGWRGSVPIDTTHLARAQAVLDDFYFVGLYETYDEDALFLFRELGIDRRLVDRQNVAREDGEVSSDFDTSAIDGAMALDRQLYTHARTLNQAFKREVGTFDDIVSQAREDMRPVRPLRYVLINWYERLLGQRRALASIQVATKCVKRIVGEENIARLVSWLFRSRSARRRKPTLARKVLRTVLPEWAYGVLQRASRLVRRRFHQASWVVIDFMDRWRGNPSAAQSFPPARLRYRVHGQRSLDSFVGMGTRCLDEIERALQTRCLRLDRFAHILDFGCGCGRILIPLMTRYPALDVSCTDTDSEAIRWCQEHLDTGTFQVNDPLLPSGYPADRFDFIYAVSVFTHLAEAHQLQWLGELQRIAAPGGFVLLTVNGEAVWRERATLSEPQRAALESNGHLFVETEFIGEKELPDWYQTAFHTAAYVRETFSRFFTVEAQIPIAMDGQDIVLLRKEARTGSGHLP